MDDPSAGADSDAAQLGQRTARGAMWTGVAFVANKAIILASTIVLTRLLTPAEFGVVAIALMIVGYVERLSEGGLEAAVIAHPGSEKDCLENGLGLSLILGGGFMVLGVAAAPLAAAAFDEPTLLPVVAVLSILYLTTSVRQLISGGLGRRMRFDKRVGPELIRASVKALVMIGLALWGWGVWALTIGHVLGALVGLLAYWRALGGGITPRFSLTESRSLLRFGGTLSLVAVVGTIAQNADYVMIGLRSDSVAVGLYSIGFRIPELTVLAVPVVASQSLIAGYSRLRSSPPELAKAYLGSLRVLSALLIPLGVGLALVADDAIDLMFGPSWSGAVPVLERVGLYAIASGLAFPLGDALKATGRASMLIAIGVVRLAVILPLLWFAAGRNLAAVAGVHVLVASVFLLVSVVVAARLLGASPAAQLKAIAAPLLAVGLMTAAVVAVRSQLDPGVVRLVIAIIAGGSVFAAALTLLDRSLVVRLISLIGLDRLRSASRSAV